jgi:hypothetical protein
VAYLSHGSRRQTEKRKEEAEKEIGCDTTIAGYRENVSAFVDTPWKIVFRFLKRLVFSRKGFFHGVPNSCLVPNFRFS